MTGDRPYLGMHRLGKRNLTKTGKMNSDRSDRS